MNRNTVWCRVLVFFENVAKNAIFTAMVVDGFYLHKLIVRVFAKDPEKYILHGVTIGECITFSIISICVSTHYYIKYKLIEKQKNPSKIKNAFIYEKVNTLKILILVICYYIVVNTTNI